MESRWKKKDDRSAHFFGSFVPTKNARKKARERHRLIHKGIAQAEKRSQNETQKILRRIEKERKGKHDIGQSNKSDDGLLSPAVSIDGFYD